MTVYVIKNTNDNRFMVCRREGLAESWATGAFYNTFEEAYRVAKVYGWGATPIDETNHH